MSRTVGALLMVLALAVAGAVRTAADDQPPVRAFASWQARGQVFQTGATQMTFVGAFTGMIYLDSAEGAIDAGYMTCPTIVDISLADGKQHLDGHCTITGKDGARVYADLSCRGVRMVGCNGDFTFTGGSDRFEGISGGGPVNIRSTISDFAAGGGNILEGAAAGIIVWPNLTYKLVNQP